MVIDCANEKRERENERTMGIKIEHTMFKGR